MKALKFPRSVAALAVAATLGFSATASASSWKISGADYTPGPTNISISSEIQNVTAPAAVTALAGTVNGEGPGVSTNIATADAQTFLTSIGLTLNDNELTYFGVQDTSAGPGYFGIAFKSTAAIRLALNAGANSATGSLGVLTTEAGTVGGFGTTWTSSATVNGGDTMLVLVGGLNVGQSFQFSAQAIAGSGFASTFNVKYLQVAAGATSFSGATTLASQSNVTGSGLNTAQLPAPGPIALLGMALLAAGIGRRKAVAA